jgi:hypothetical protein
VSIKLQRESLVQAVHSFCLPFMTAGHPFAFTADLSLMVASELPEDCGDGDEPNYLWPFNGSAEVASVVIEALAREGYEGEVVVGEFDCDLNTDWAIGVDVKFKKQPQPQEA